MIPNLIIPGAPKSGTSSLHEYLDLHPDIEMSRVKEPHFFTHNERYEQELDFYQDIFIDSNAKYYGESSTAYFSDEVSISRIKDQIPDTKFIVILRNPVDRTISHYLWQVSLLQEFRSFKKAVQFNIQNPVNYRRPGWGGHFKNYYGSSLYGKNLIRLIENFGKKNVFLITTKELAENPDKCLNNCFEFLGIDRLKISSKIRSNKTKKILGGKELIKKFIGKSIKRGVIDLRLLYRVLKPSIGRINENDKLWLRDLFDEDLSILRKEYPNIEKRW